MQTAAPIDNQLTVKLKHPSAHSLRDPSCPDIVYDSGPAPPPLLRIPVRQIQYRSYQQAIEIYHFRSKHVSVHDFRQLLIREAHGYICTLIGEDTLTGLPVPLGDFKHRTSIEVGYLPGVFPITRRISGSALGFRMNNGTIEWLCFNLPIDDILATWVWKKKSQRVIADTFVKCESKCKLFDKVARIEKGLKDRRVKGAHPEHKYWHDSLLDAKHPRVSLKLTWKNKVNELQELHYQQRAAAEKAVRPRRIMKQTHFDDDGDVKMIGEYG